MQLTITLGVNSYIIKTSIICLLLMSTMSYGQIPDGYYDNASGLSGEDLKTALHNIIKGHTEYPYSSSSTDVWDILKDADKDPDNHNNVIGIYSDFRMDADGEFNSGNGWNREHVWPRSRGDFGTSLGAGTDAHHLRAADISTNSARSNRNFDYGDFQYVDSGGAYSGSTDSRSSNSTFVWEPRDLVKGDIARMIFYMATRYEGDNGELDLELTETLLSNTNKSPAHAKLSVLLAWHLADPVSTEEQNRNDIIYSYQNNRNPYIDHPEYVCQVYTCESGGNNAPFFTSSAVTSATESIAYTYSITATDADGDDLTITATTLPSWLTLTDNGHGTATLDGTPSTSDIGSHSVVLLVSDGSKNSSQSFTITVNETAGNTAPNFTSSAPTSVVEGTQYLYNITTTDAESDEMTITGATIPTWLTLVDNGGGSAILSGEPNTADIGSHSVVITVADTENSNSQSFTINVSAANGEGKASDLFFSEYIEGSSLNKALELANFTGSDLDLSAYSIMSQPNGNGEWTNELTLSGTLVQGDVYIVVNNSADATMIALADLLSGSGVVSFNGNDALGLFKNGTLIDQIGEFNNDADFAKNTTLVRKSNVSSPNSTYNEEEWEVHASNTFSFLGSHTFDGGSSNACEVPSGLSNSNVTGNSADLSWEASANSDSYNVWYKPSTNTAWTNTSIINSDLTVTGLIASTEYEYKVQSVCDGFGSEFSAVSVFTTLDLITSFLNNLISNDMSVVLFPNPSSNHLNYNIELLSSQYITVSIYDLKGHVLLSVNEKIINGTFTNQVDVSNLANGIYILKISTKHKVKHSQAFAIQR